MSTALLVCVSVSHGNTRRVAEAMAPVLGARVVEPEDITADDLVGCDLVGFGSGIYNQRVHPRLRDFVAALPDESMTGRAFVFGTSGFPPLTTKPLHRRLRRAGFTVDGEFFCRGYDTSPPFGWFGGAKRERPNGSDLESAREFARTLIA
ncbi:flavodoxin family protein [Gordonia sp. (in: high G+C Gram-positive bacteria)]|uniref:flavodoxin family protein n=1 Tax=Gordonia sp. (in: high G+C Gram-positive bacteria) TaxID=84139 RepID=UPI0039E7074D